MAFVYFYCTKKAKESAYATTWFIVPTIIFTIVPLIIKLWPKEETKLSFYYFIELIFNNFVILSSFILPIIFLSISYISLKYYEENIK